MISKFLLIIFCFLLSWMKSQGGEKYYRNLYKDHPSHLITDFDRYNQETQKQEDKIYLLYYTIKSCQDHQLSNKSKIYLQNLETELDHYQGNLPFRSVMYSNISMLYNNEGLNYKAKMMLEQAIYLAEKITLKNSKYQALSYYYFRSAHISSVNKEMDNAIKLYLKANRFFDKIGRKDGDELSYIGSAIGTNTGDFYMDRKEYDDAILFTSLAIKRDQTKDKSESGVAFYNLGHIFSEKKEKDSALKYYIKSIKPLQSARIYRYANTAYDSIKMIYKSAGDVKMYNHYSKLQFKNLKLLEGRDESVIQLQEKPNLLSEKMWIVLVFILVIICSLIILYYSLKNKRHQKGKVLITEPYKMINSSKGMTEHLENKGLEKEKVKNISVENEEYLMTKLKEFEKELLFLDPSISLARVSVFLNSSTKTISELINKHSGTNFNQYINKLRIEYICEKLKNEKKYRKYKISYLADECGYISHSTFTKIFKLNTGSSPSEYIEFLDSQNQ